MKHVKLADEAGSADEDAAEDFKNYLLSVIQGKSYVEEQVFNTDETRFFDKDIGKSIQCKWHFG